MTRTSLHYTNNKSLSKKGEKMALG